MPHDLSQNDAMVRMRSGVKSIHCLSGDLQGGGEAEGRLRLDDVVVNGLGQVEDVETCLHEPPGVLRRTPAAQAYERIKFVFLAVLDNGRNHVAGLAVDDHSVDFVPTGAEHGTASRQDA